MWHVVLSRKGTCHLLLLNFLSLLLKYIKKKVVTGKEGFTGEKCEHIILFSGKFSLEVQVLQHY